MKNISFRVGDRVRQKASVFKTPLEGVIEPYTGPAYAGSVCVQFADGSRIVGPSTWYEKVDYEYSSDPKVEATARTLLQARLGEAAHTSHGGIDLDRFAYNASLLQILGRFGYPSFSKFALRDDLVLLVDVDVPNPDEPWNDRVRINGVDCGNRDDAIRVLAIVAQPFVKSFVCKGPDFSKDYKNAALVTIAGTQETQT